MSMIVPALPGEVTTLRGPDLSSHLRRWSDYLREKGVVAATRQPVWLSVLRDGLGHQTYALEIVQGNRTRGFLPLAHVNSWVFGRFLVSLPYVNSAGVVADDESCARLLIAEAVKLADKLNVKYLEMRHEQVIAPQAFTDKVNGKVHMRLRLPPSPDTLWRDLDAKVRNQVRKAEKNGLEVVWGRDELLGEFYDVFSHNMRDLGTPVYGRPLFTAILYHLKDGAEFCVVRKDRQPVAGALLLHGEGVSEVPSASSLRAFNATNANMLMYWNLLRRAIERGQTVFDFGRSTPDGSTYRFKKQWGAEPHPAEWQYHRRNGQVNDARPDNPRYQKLIKVWQKLPLWLTRWIGPPIVRGIP
jgi:FemAB-related protein (PEP-CTERM system-associated)